jgi:hypothetical protein
MTAAVFCFAINFFHELLSLPVRKHFGFTDYCPTADF